MIDEVQALLKSRPRHWWPSADVIKAMGGGEESMTRFKTTNYARGRAFEYRVKKHYEGQGWLVLRTAGSHGPVDLVCLKHDFRPVFIQCKNRKPTKKEMTELETFTNYYMVDGFMVYPDARRRLVEI